MTTKIKAGVIGDGVVGTTQIADDAISQAKIADDAVGADQLASSAVVTASIADGAITSAKLDTNIAVGGTLNVSGAFTSLGIDDNADATAITIDSDENILIGTDTLDAWYTSTNGGVNILGSANFIAAARSGGTPFIANRLSSDGGIMEFKKDGTAVGSIGIESGGFYIDGESAHSGLSFGGNSVVARDNGTRVDNTVDLGSSVHRFKDLYLSGGAYIGGTGAANKLDDYEEGNWTPALSGSGGTSGVTYSRQQGSYTKVGNQVTINFHIVLSNEGTLTGTTYIGGLPFIGNNSPSYQVATLAAGLMTIDDNQQVLAIQYAANALMYMFLQEPQQNLAQISGNAQYNNTTELAGSLTYFTNL